MQIAEIDVDELQRRLDAGARLIDVRESDEYDAGHVAGAISLPLSELVERAAEVRGDGEALVICARGSRSFQAAQYLAARGVVAVNVAGGTMAWEASGRLLADGARPTDR